MTQTAASLPCPDCGAANKPGVSSCASCGATMVMTATIAATATTATRPEFSGILPPGTMLHERYELGELLGRGGMGAVYRARDVTLDEVVALKIMRPEFAENPKMAERFLSEIKLARRVRHRNVCVIHDYGKVEGTLYISMELIEGVDLKKHLTRHGGLSPEQAYDVALQVADGLHAVHETGVVHRDLKPSNVVFGTDGIARLMDFGIAKRQSGSQGITATGDIVGTPEYMSPEQAQGRALDARSDVYALGVLVYELFSGHLPFRGDTPISTILKHIQEPPPLDGPTAANIPPAMKAVLKRALSKDPTQRYANAGEMASAIREARQGRAVPPLRAASSSSSSPAPAAHRSALPFAAGAAAVLLVAAGSWVVLRQTPAPAPTPAPITSLATPPPLTTTPAPTPATVESAPALAATVAPAADPVAQSPRPTPRPTPTPRPVAVPTVVPTVAPTAPPTPVPGPARPGTLQIVVRPWGEVAVDGRVIGETPLGAISLPAGEHVVRVRHPGWEPLEKRVTIPAGETARLVVDLATEGRKR